MRICIIRGDQKAVCRDNDWSKSRGPVLAAAGCRAVIIMFHLCTCSSEVGEVDQQKRAPICQDRSVIGFQLILISDTYSSLNFELIGQKLMAQLMLMH